MDNSLQLQAILWDFGGVFTTSPFENFNKLEAELGAPRDFIRQVNSTNPDKNAWAQFESNSVSLDDFDVLFADESEGLGFRIEGKAVINVLSGDLRPRMVEVLKQPPYSPVPIEKQVLITFAGANGYLDDLPVKDVTAFESSLLESVEANHKATSNLSSYRSYLF
jgi:hypothetical protein